MGCMVIGNENSPCRSNLQGVKERRKCQINAIASEDCISGRDVPGKRWMLTRKVRRIKGRAFSF